MTEANSEPATNSTIAEPRHGGQSGWYRIAAGFCALAAIQMGVAAWSTARGATGPDGDVPRPGLAVFMLLSMLALFVAAFLAARRRRFAGFFVLGAYAVPAVAIYVAVQVPVAPSGLMLVALLVLMIADGFRRRSSTPEQPS